MDGSNTNVIQYVTIATTGNAIDFGDLTLGRSNITGCSSTTRGIFAGGYTGGGLTNVSNVIDYVTIASTGNATDFGDLTLARFSPAGCSSSTRGLFAGGYGGGNVNIIDYITIASTGNATDFGDLLATTRSLCGMSSTVRACFAGGNPGNNVIQYVTIASTGNSTDFGDLMFDTTEPGGCSNASGGVQ